MNDYSVLPQHAALVYYEVVSIPRYGVLKLNDAFVSKGDRFTEDDIIQGRLRYVQTVNLPQGVTSWPDSFKFTVGKRGQTTRQATQFSPCMPVPDIDVPENGVYTFPITIMALPTPSGVVRGINLGERTVKTLTTDNIDIASTGTDSSRIIHSVSNRPKHGNILLNGAPTLQFTQLDVIQGRVQYEHTGDTATPHTVIIKSCNNFSKCVSSTMSVSLTPALKFTGDNVFYAGTDMAWQAVLTANREPLLWTLVNGTDQGPPLSTAATGIVSWSYYDYSDEDATNAPARGAGYDKLDAYRNIPLAYQWEGGLPLGMYLSNLNGIVTTAVKVSYNQYALTHNSTRYTVRESWDSWKTPDLPANFSWQVRVLDPYTGETATRWYHLRVTTSGYGPNGQISETV